MSSQAWSQKRRNYYHRIACQDEDWRRARRLEQSEYNAARYVRMMQRRKARA